MRVRILGSAAGGGLPQWNCRCANCDAVRAGSPDIAPRTQSSLAISGDGRAWFLINVSPDIRRQILDSPDLLPKEGITGSSSLARDPREQADPPSARTEKRNPYHLSAVRGTPIAGCLLTDAEFDHTAGLLLMREQGGFTIYCTDTVYRWLTREFPLHDLLAPFNHPFWQKLPLDTLKELPLPDGSPSGLTVRAFEVDRHVPRYVHDDVSTAGGSVIGLDIQDTKTGGRLVYAPCLASIGDALAKAVAEADCVLIDGTFWTDDELIRLGISDRPGRAMGHLPVSGADGSLAWLGGLKVPHRAYVHINNTNPMLNRRGPEHAEVTACGVRVAEDGDEFNL